MKRLEIEIREADECWKAHYGEDTVSVRVREEDHFGTLLLSRENADRIYDFISQTTPKVCGNCTHGKSTFLDDIRCYKRTPYMSTGYHCAACDDWQACEIRANPRVSK